MIIIPSFLEKKKNSSSIFFGSMKKDHSSELNKYNFSFFISTVCRVYFIVIIVSRGTRGAQFEKVLELDSPPPVDHLWRLDCSSYFGV